MPVFGSKRQTTPPNTTAASNEQERKGSLFGRRSVDNHTDNSSVTTTTTQSQKRGGFFGIGGRNITDPMILAAGEKVTAAEQVCQWRLSSKVANTVMQAEREADRILAAARQAVVQAREHARKLELEAEEEYADFPKITFTGLMFVPQGTTGENQAG